MAKCVRIQNNKKIICTGAMKHWIKIINRDIEPEKQGYTIDRTDFIEVRAYVRVINKPIPFDGINTEFVETHIFGIRFGPTIEKNYSIELKGNYYLVKGIENLNEENRFLEIETVKRGTIQKMAAW